MTDSIRIAILKELEKIFAPEQIIENALMSDYTTFKIGGAAAVIVEPKSAEEIKKAVEIFSAFSQGYLVLGNGSNVLADDGGIDMPVIRVGKRMSAMSVFDNCLTVQGGAALSAAANFAAEHSLSGLEFAAGIPGTVGGGVIMNAGAYGGELKDVVEAVSFVGPDGREYAAENGEMEFGYRRSAISDSGCIVTGVTFILRKGNKTEIFEKIRQLNARRREKQPLEYPSAGSAFKRPEGHYAAALIEEAGLKGYTSGGAAVSQKHAGFVINLGGAASADVLNVMEHVRKTVYEKSGVTLEPEIKIWGNER